MPCFQGLIEPKGFALELPEENLIVLKELDDRVIRY
jgi:hypothetical protein